MGAIAVIGGQSGHLRGYCGGAEGAGLRCGLLGAVRRSPGLHLPAWLVGVTDAADLARARRGGAGVRQS